jgi:putative ABC transport system substrate-binding protein
MRRRTLILAAVALVAVPPLGFGQAKPRTVRIAVLAGDLTTPQEEEALLAGLREQGLVEGRNLVIERRYAQGRLDQVPVFAREIADGKFDAVIATCTPTTRIAQQALGSAPGSTPIVMAAVADPVGQQIIASLARPGANVTGLASQAEETMPRMLSLFAAVLPAKATIAVLADASSGVHPKMWQALEQLAPRLNVRLLQVQAGRRPGQPSLPDAFDAAVRQRADGIFVLPDEPFFFARRADIVALADRYRLPSFYGVREFVDAGGLMSYGESLSAAFRGVGSYVSKLASGAKPGEIPVARPTVFELVVNLRTAKALGITVPRDVLLSADSVIQ